MISKNGGQWPTIFCLLHFADDRTREYTKAWKEIISNQLHSELFLF